MNHTPGPWTAHDADGTGTLPCVLSDKVNAGGNFYVAQCNNYADARLIAAAPQLLEALRAVQNGFADGSIKWAKPRRADSDPYHPANMLMCAAIEAAEEA